MNRKPGAWELYARLMTLSLKKRYCCVIQKSENRMQSGRTFYGRLWLKKGCFANDDGDGNDNLCYKFELHSGDVG
jgi:hypothetical protein